MCRIYCIVASNCFTVKQLSNEGDAVQLASLPFHTVAVLDISCLI